MKKINPNDLLLASRKMKSKSLLILEQAPTSAEHHSKLINLAYEKKSTVDAGTLLVCLDVVDGNYGINVKVIEPISGRQGWMVYGTLEFTDES